MKRWLSAPALLLSLLTACPAWGQAVIAPFRPSAPNRPTVSPYLNLNRGGPAGINYFNLVRPQFETQRSLQTINQELQQFGAGQFPGAMGAGTANPLTTGIVEGGTGYPTYMYYSHYFPSMPQTGVSPIGIRR